MKKLAMQVAVIGLATVLAGCGNSSGDEYVGTWKKLSGRGPESRTIEKRDAVFVIKQPCFGFTCVPGSVTQKPAILKDGVLQVQGEFAEKLVFDKSSGHLLLDGAEYERATK
ncbi:MULTISPECIES: hypothetical protein [Burkholderia]|uniref:hypothetical protein n=1 Tax=Burkholderia TaxID=32008 RepID=UPI000536BE76|nr:MULTISPECIES: hypothetical protein [Burkholderia]KGX19482.1 putative lipoprotein [Burkholderia pseudomallei ABCPW 1]